MRVNDDKTAQKDKKSKRDYVPRFANRKELLLDHLLAFIAEEGFEAITMRALALKAGVTVGTVQHYFATKQDMLFAAMEHGRERTEAELASRFKKTNTTLKLETLLLMLTPQRSESELSRVWLAFVSQAPYDKRFADSHQTWWSGLEKTITLLMADEWKIDKQRAKPLAAEALALVDGLAIAVITEPARMTPENARAITQQWMERTRSTIADDLL